MEISEIQKLPISEETAAAIKCVIDFAKLSSEIWDVLVTTWGAEEAHEILNRDFNWDGGKVVDLVRTRIEQILYNAENLTEL